MLLQGQRSSATPHIKARQGPAVPDMFMIPPDEKEIQYAAMRKRMTGRSDHSMLLGSEAAAQQYIVLYAEELMPTEDTIKEIAGNESLLAGFDDPEVMRAVQDVAQNPANIQKYKNNEKVRASCKAE